MRKNLPLEELNGLLTQPRCAVLATNYADGTTLLSPVRFEWRDGGFTIVIFDNDVKAKHIKRDPRVSVVVADDRVPLSGIEVRGRAEIVPTDPDLAALRRMAVRYIGPHRGNAYIDGFDPATQLTLRIAPGVLRTWDFADEAPLSMAFPVGSALSKQHRRFRCQREVVGRPLPWRAHDLDPRCRPYHVWNRDNGYDRGSERLCDQRASARG